MKTLLRVLIVGIVCATAAACGSSGGTSGGSPTASPTYSPSAMSCDQLAVRASNLVSVVHYAGLNLGTDNDSSAYWTEMDEVLADVRLNLPECAPAAGPAVDDLAAAVNSARETYQPGSDPAVVATNRAVLAQVTTAGAAAWTALGLDPSPWETTVRSPA